ncbi:MAG: VWA domain-containing protein [Chloroflexota bacterium]|nr:VWA domain-containing protein [Chloroflexota bacterium]
MADEPAPAPGLLGGGPYRYVRWDGRQRLPELGADEVLDAVVDDVLVESDLGAALGRLFNRGLRGQGGGERDLAGLAALRNRLARAREQLLSRFNLGDVLNDVSRELDEIVAAERRTVERALARDASDAADRARQLNSLPSETAGRIRRLQDYDFLEPEAGQRFDALVERLRRQVLDSYFSGMADALRGMTPAQLAANREMIRELNTLLQQRLDGGDPDASGFLTRHGRHFPGARTLDDIVEQLAARMAQMQSLLASLTREQRTELQETMDALLRDDRLRWDLAQLAATLDQLLAGGLGQRFEFVGSEGLSLEGALQQLGRLAQLDALNEQMAHAGSPAELEALDPDAVGELLGPDSAADVRAMQQLVERLEEAGYAERRGDRLTLTARGARRVGQRVLDELFSRLYRDAFGGHRQTSVGAGGERGEGSVRYEFGRPFEVDLNRTLWNALSRGGRRPRAPSVVAIEPSDFEVFETESTARAATVLLVDMSRSMLQRGCFVAAKKVALALDMLIRTRFPRDELHVIGFAYYARRIRPEGLAGLSWHGFEYGTNLQHGLMMARGLLARSHAANREIVVITDGEPTAHFEAGQVEFSYPPTRRTMLATLREVGRCTRDGITINTFMLERSRALADFVERMTRLNRGRAFYATPEHLGEYVLVDYVSRRSRVV